MPSFLGPDPRRYWYVDDNRVPVTWASAVTGGVAQIRVLRLAVDNRGQQAMSLWAVPGQVVTAAQLADAKAEAGTGTPPPPEATEQIGGSYAKGRPGGVASLNASGVVPRAQLPSDLGGTGEPTSTEGLVTDEELATALGALTPSSIGAQPAGAYATEQDVANALAADLADVIREGDARLSDARTPLGHTHTAAQVTGLPESVQDIVGAMVKAGSNVTAAYDDTAGTLTLSSTATGGGTVTADGETIRDTIAAAIVAGPGVQVLVDDAADTITVRVAGLTVADVSGLQALLDAKASTTHAHTAAQISNATTSGRTVLTGTPAAARTALEIVTADITVADIVASGTRSSSTYLAGDGSWRTPAGGTGGGGISVAEPERSVEDYGTVDPTGQQDSAPAFRAAVAAIKAGGTFGGELVIRRPGRYRLDPLNGVGLELGPGGSPIKLSGIGYMQDQGSTKYATLVPGAAMEALVRVSGYDCILSDLQVDGTALADRAVDLKAPACRIVQCGITGGRLWALAGTSGAGDSTSSHRTTIDGGFFKNESNVDGGGTMWTEGADWLVGGSVRILGGKTTLLARSSGGQYSNLHVTAGGGLTTRTLDVDGIQQTFMGLYLDSANAGNDLVTVTSGLDTRLIGCHIYQNIAAACASLIRVNGGSVQVAEMSARQTGTGGTWASAVHIATAYSAARSGVWNSNFPMGTTLWGGTPPAVWRDVRFGDAWQSKP